MWWLLAFLIFATIVGSTWWFGLWSNVLTLMNFFIAALVASSFYENAAALICSQDNTYRYIADFVGIWGLFALVMMIMRFSTEILSSIRLKFHPVVELVGQGLICCWLGVAFVSFTFFTLHLAPLPPNSFQTGPDVRMLGIGPDRLWMAFIQSRSRGALAAYRQSSLFPAYTLTPHPDDANLDARVFDPIGNFLFEQAARRMRLSKYTVLRVN